MPRTEAPPIRRITVAQAAAEWSLHVDTLRAAIRRGELPAVWAGNGWRLLPSDVEAWVAARWGQRSPVPS